MRCKCGNIIGKTEFLVDPDTDMCGVCRKWLELERQFLEEDLKDE